MQKGQSDHPIATPAQFIRARVFGFDDQEGFAHLIGCSQATISRYESGRQRISRTAQERIRAKAKERGIAWNDAWFFELPADAA